ncbi:hypothetical protein A3L09_07140 [Thermococcus profundus]|uniref:Class III signal peptide-containing protein n=1 Tax=Thermococcus profundus TaxID=49899 RepID=A0A2Z2MB78_THEPR|nr:class III signal peptide-containing protein [Thermococcus profundus]ASJ03046.1 hypothetical protein A3L09_07140 [Thermococcus profundus]
MPGVKKMPGVRRGQSALEYLFMLAAALVLVAVAIKVVLDATKDLQQNIGDYTSNVRKEIMENL